jgi:hypothetical protein
VRWPEAGSLALSAAARDHELAALYRSWGFLELLDETVASMPTAWLAILNLARTLIDGRSLPGVDVPDDLLNLVGPAEREIVTMVRTEHRRRVVISPSDDTTLSPLKHIFDFAQITLPDLMLRQLDPELFEFRLMSGDINGQYPVDSRPTTEEWDELVEERVLQARPVRKRRQKVYVLLDVSNSMREDNRMIFARALVLAYLLSAVAEGAKLYLRTFANTIHERTDCLDRADFAPLARRVLSVTPDGGTDIKRALDIAIGDIRRIDEVNTYERMFEAPPTEILLVSDCESYSVPYIPPGIKLHTVHLKSPRMMRSYEEGFARIRAESTSFHEIDTAALLLPDTTVERWLLLQDGRPLDVASPGGHVTEAKAGGHRAGLREVYERLEEAEDSRASIRRRVRTMGPALPFLQLWRAICAACGRWRPWRRGARAPKPASQPVAAGLEFRLRR